MESGIDLGSSTDFNLSISSPNFHSSSLSFSPKIESHSSPQPSPLFPPSSNLESLVFSDTFALSSSTPNLGSSLSNGKRPRGNSFLELSLPSPSMTPYNLRRSPRLAAFSTPTFTMPSPALPSALKELRRSPRLAFKQEPSFSPSAFLQSPPMSPIGSGPALPRAASISSKPFSGSLTNNGFGASAENEGGMLPPQMSILNKLQQSNLNSNHVDKKRRKDSQDLGNKLKSTSASGAMLAPFTPPKPSDSLPAPSLPQMQQLPKPLISVMNCPKSTGNGSGSSCHQCKSRRSMNNLIFCCNMFTKRNKDKQRKTGEKRHVCRKKYCDQCLQKFYHEKPPAQRQDPSSNWPCPACRGLCCCAACRRQKAKKGSDPLTMSPATSLACGLVYFKDMLKFKLGEPANDAQASATAAAGAANLGPALQKALAGLNRGHSTLLDGSSSSSAGPPALDLSVKEEPAGAPHAVETVSSILKGKK